MEQDAQNEKHYDQLWELGFDFRLDTKGDVIYIYPDENDFDLDYDEDEEGIPTLSDTINQPAVSWAVLGPIIRNFKKLQHLVAKSNLIDVYDLGDLSELTELERIDLATETLVEDLSSLNQLKKLTFLRLNQSKVSNLSPLEKLGGLEEIHLPNAVISDVLPLATLNQLETINLANNKIADISPILKIATLTNIDFSGNKLLKIASFKPQQFISVRLNNNQLTDIGFLAGMENSLQELAIANNPLSDISLLASFSKLRVLEISGIKVPPGMIEKFNSLDTLIASNCAIHDLNFLKSLIHLKHFDLSHNNIGNRLNLGYFKTQLLTINLSYNQIDEPEDIVEFHQLLGYGLQQLDLTGNTFGNKNFSRLSYVSKYQNEISDFRNYLKKNAYHEGNYDALHTLWYMNEDPVAENCYEMYNALNALPKKDHFFRQHLAYECESMLRHYHLFEDRKLYHTISPRIDNEKRKYANNQLMNFTDISEQTALSLNDPAKVAQNAHLYYIIATRGYNSDHAKLYCYQQLVKIKSPFRYPLFFQMSEKIERYDADIMELMLDFKRDFENIETAKIEKFDFLACYKTAVEHKKFFKEIEDEKRWFSWKKVGFIVVLILWILKTIDMLMRM